MQLFRNFKNPRQTVLFDGDIIVGYTGLVQFPLISDEWEQVEYLPSEVTPRKVTSPNKNVYDMFIREGYSAEEAAANSGYQP